MDFTVPGMQWKHRQAREATERISPGRRLMHESCRVRGMQSAYTTMSITFRINFQRAALLLKQHPGENGRRLSRSALFIKASAIALKHHPWMNDMISAGGTSIIKSSSIDIGLCVQGAESFPRFIVLREADTAGLSEITRWLRSESSRARTGEPDYMASLDLLGRLLPFSVLKKLFLRYYINNHRVRRNLVGTFLISMLHGREVMHASFQSITPTAFLIIGGVTTMPFEIHGKLRWLPAVQCTLNADHRVVDGMKAVNFGKEIVTLIEHPESLADSAPASQSLLRLV